MAVSYLRTNIVQVVDGCLLTAVAWLTTVCCAADVCPRLHFRRCFCCCQKYVSVCPISAVVHLYLLPLCCRLAEAGPLAADELSMEYVPLYDFLGETTQLLDEVRHAAWWFWAV